MFGLPNDYTHSKQGDDNRADVKTITETSTLS